jgi:hypothetical protein
LPEAFKGLEQEKVEVSIIDMLMRVDADHSMFFDNAEMKSFLDLLIKVAEKHSIAVDKEQLYGLLPAEETFTFLEAL